MIKPFSENKMLLSNFHFLHFFKITLFFVQTSFQGLIFLSLVFFLNVFMKYVMPSIKLKNENLKNIPLVYRICHKCLDKIKIIKKCKNCHFSKKFYLLIEPSIFCIFFFNIFCHKKTNIGYLTIVLFLIVFCYTAILKKQKKIMIINQFCISKQLATNFFTKKFGSL